jgi:hypothetical protein
MVDSFTHTNGSGMQPIMEFLKITVAIINGFSVNRHIHFPIGQIY